MAYTGRLGSTSAQPANFQPGSFGRVDITIEAPFCNALADAAPPALEKSNVYTAPPADATASAPPPSVLADLTFTIPSATANASFPTPAIGGQVVRGIDVPTFLRLSERTGALRLQRVTTSALSPNETTLSFPGATTLTFGGGSTLTLSPATTTLELELESILVLDDHARVLVFDH